MATRLSTPWTKNPWFETVSEAQRRARKQLPSPVYSALLAGSEAGVTVTENVAAFSRLGLRPVTVGQTRGHDMATSVMGVDLSMPVIADVKTGSSGSGGSPSLGSHHSERSGAMRSFKPTGHRHSAEVIQELTVNGCAPQVVSTLPMRRRRSSISSARSR